MNEQHQLPLGENIKGFRKRFIWFFSSLSVVILIVTLIVNFVLFQRQMEEEAAQLADMIKEEITYLEYHHMSNPEHGYRLDDHHYASLKEYVVWIKERIPQIRTIVYYDKEQHKVIGTTNLAWFHMSLEEIPDKRVQNDLEILERTKENHRGSYFNWKVFDYSYYSPKTLLTIQLNAALFWKSLLLSIIPFSLLSVCAIIILLYIPLVFLKKSIFFPLHNLIQRTYKNSPINASKFQPEQEGSSQVKPSFLNIITELIRKDLSEFETHENWIISIVKSHPTPSFLVNSLGEILFVNDSLNAALKIGEGQSIKNWLDYISDEDKGRVTDAWDKQLHKLEPFEQEFRLKNTENQTFWVFGKCCNLKNANDQTIGFIATIQPIDRWKQ